MTKSPKKIASDTRDSNYTCLWNELTNKVIIEPNENLDGLRDPNGYLPVGVGSLTEMYGLAHLMMGEWVS